MKSPPDSKKSATRQAKRRPKTEPPAGSEQDQVQQIKSASLAEIVMNPHEPVNCTTRDANIETRTPDVVPMRPFQGFWCDYGDLRLVVECEVDQRTSYGMYDLALDTLNAIEIGFADTFGEAEEKVIAAANRHMDRTNEPQPANPTWTPYFNKIAAFLAHL